MPWVVSNSGGSGYAWSAINTYNQHAAKVTLPSNCAVTKLRIVAAGYNSGTVPTRIAIWNVGGSALGQCSTFNMADGSESVQYTYEKTITSLVLSSGDYWVGIYRDPSESHIFQTTSGSGDGYRKTNTSSFPSIASMSSYNTDTNDEPTVGAFYITAPADISGQSVSRVSDSNQSISWTNNSSADQPYDNIYIERYDNVTGSYYALTTLSGSTSSYSDTTTTSNRFYRYRLRAKNDAGYSNYVYTGYINTTPADPTSVSAVRVGGNVELTWVDNALNEDNYELAKRESLDGGVTWEAWDYVSLPDQAANATSYTDTSPYTYGQYAVRAKETAQTLYSSWVWSNEVVTLATPDEPTGLSPDSIVYDGADARTFSWNHNPTDGTAQTKYSLRYRVQGGSFPGTPQYDEVSSTDEFVSITGGTFTNGNVYEWQVKTWGEYSTGSDWSDTATFTVTSSPVGTITDPTAISNYAYSELTVEWTYTQAEANSQAQYLCKLYDENDSLLESKQVSSVVANGGTGSCTFDYSLSNSTDYKVTLQVQESDGLWSDETEVEFTTDFLQPPKPTISLSLNETEGSVDISITNPDVIDEYNEIATHDSYVRSLYVNNNYNSDGQLDLFYTSGADKRYVVLNFDMPSITGRTVVSASVVLYRITETGTAYSQIQYINTAFDESTITYSNLYVDGTVYDNHLHTAGDSESWDVTSLIQDIADGVITDFEGFCVLPLNTGGNFSSEFYDKSESGKEPTLLISLSPINEETSYNEIYRSINGGSWELVQTSISKNTTITDYIPNIGGNNNYYCKAVSDIPSINTSDESDLDVELTGMFFINGGNGFELITRLVGDISLKENINRNESIKQFAGRTYPVKYQGDNKIQNIAFSADCPVTKYDTLVSIIEYVGNVFYRDWRGRWFYCMLTQCSFTKKDNLAYQFDCTIIRLELET